MSVLYSDTCCKIMDRAWLLSVKAEASDRDADGVVFCTDNSGDNGGSNFVNSNLQDDDDFSPTFNVPDMDISAGALRLQSSPPIFQCKIF